MSDTTVAGAPVAGWYDDPSGAAPYRWWDGSHWTPQTLDRIPSADPAAPALEETAPSPAATQAPPAPASPVTALPDGSFPSRRSLREATQAVPIVPVEPRRDPAAPQPTPWPQDAPGHPAAPAAAPSPEVADDTAFHAPSAWAANAPAAPLPPVETVPPLSYAEARYGSARLQGGAPRGAHPYGAPSPYGPASRLPHEKNRPARWALTIPLLSIVLGPAAGLLERSGAAGAVLSGLFSLAVLGGLVAAIPLGILGLVQANNVEKMGRIARGRPHAIIGMVLAVLMLFFGIAAAVTVLQQRNATATGTSQVVPAQTVPTPDAGAPQESNGQTSYVYDEAMTENSIKQAIIAKTHLTPTSVTCPASEPIVVGTTFDCTVNLAAGMLTAHMAVTSDQGQLVISSVSAG